MINLYIVNKSCPAAAYGIGTYISELTNSLDRSLINISIIHLNSDAEFVTDVFKDGIRHLHIPVSNISNSTLGSKDYNARYLKNVVYVLRKHITESENLIFHLNYNKLPGLAIELRSSFECRVLTVVHYLDWQMKLLGNYSHFKKIHSKDDTERTREEHMLYSSFLDEKLVFSSVERVIALSHNTRDILVDEYSLLPERINVIPNGLRDGCLTGYSKEALLYKWHINPADRIILFVGRLDIEKGVKYLIKAFGKLIETMPNSRLFIVGNGEFAEYMSESFDFCSRVTYTGMLDKTRLYELYQIANLGVISSFHEQCSYVAIEMMMHGLPIITSTTTGLNEMLEDGISCFHIPVIVNVESVELDIDALAAKMLYVLQNPDVAHELGYNARKRYENIYSSSKMGHAMTEFYLDLSKDKNEIDI